MDEKQHSPADGESSEVASAANTGASAQSGKSTGHQRRRLRPAIAVPASVIAIVVAGLVVVGIAMSRSESQSTTTVRNSGATPTAQPGTPAVSGTAAPRLTPAGPPRFATNPVRLQIEALHRPRTIAVDHANTLYIGDWSTGGGLLYKLPAGATTPALLPINGLSGPCAMTFNKRGDLYLLDGCSYAGSTLLKIPAGSSTPVELTAHLPHAAWDIAVDSHDNLYLACHDHSGSQVVKLAPGATEPTVVPQPGLDSVSVLAVDGADNLYEGTVRGAVIKFNPAAPEAVTPLPFPVLGDSKSLQAITVDAAGTVYALTNDSGLEEPKVPAAVTALPAAAPTPTTVNFGDKIHYSAAIVVDDSGIYVATDGSTTNQDGYIVLLRRAE